MKQENIRTYLALSFAMFFWGFSFIWFKQANEYYPPLTIVFARLLISSVLLLFYSWMKAYLIKISRKELLFFLLLSLFNPFFYFIGESMGLSRVSSTTGAIIIATIPVFVPFAAHFFHKEKLSWLNYAGSVISFTGVLFIILRKDLSIAASPTGVLFLCFAVFSAVVYTILLRKISFKYRPVFIITIQNLFGTILFLPLFLITDLKIIKQIPFSTAAILPVLELAIFASSFAFIFYAYGIKKIGAGKASIFTNTIPIFTAVFSIFILGDILTMQIVVGILIVITGLFLSQIKKGVFKSTESIHQD